jgi:tRNA pseudouridine(55) synthase
MSRRSNRRSQERPGPAGFLVIDKPRGWTSHDAVDAARGWLGTRRVGHLGTLDPLATGVLPLAVREATKLAPFLQGGDKSYAGTIRLGEETDTLDAEGRTLRRHAGASPARGCSRRSHASWARSCRCRRCSAP